MSKSLYIAEKPSVAREFANVLKLNARKYDGYMEAETAVVTWCVGHLVTMSYPEVYDANLKRWNLDTLPFLPKQFKYEVIKDVKKQFDIVSKLLNRDDVTKIYVCTDSGREGEYIYRLVEQMADIKSKEKDRRRVWIDSQTEEEILRGIKEAKNLDDYDNLAESAYLRAKEDYLMGINFSRLLTLKYGQTISNFMRTDRTVLSVGRVMTCVLGMIVRREREIRVFVKTAFYRVIVNLPLLSGDTDEMGNKISLGDIEAEWKAVADTKYYMSSKLYKENGWRIKSDAENLIEEVKSIEPVNAVVEKVERKNEKKNPPLLYNLAELQNDCSKMFKISPDEALKAVQSLYERKLVTYPRTDARVLSTAVAKEVYKNLSGIRNIPEMKEFAEHILNNGLYKGINKTKYVNDKQITDHYAIIPTGQSGSALNSLASLERKIYEVICRRFLSIFYPPAVYKKVSIETVINGEHFFASFKVLSDEGYLIVADVKRSLAGGLDKFNKDIKANESKDNIKDTEQDGAKCSKEFLLALEKLKKGDILIPAEFTIKEGETSPPKRYSSGSIILSMENAGQLIEDETLREQIKGSGIGTSATRAEILKKLVTIKYLSLNKKTQIITPTLFGELVFEVVDNSITQLLNPDLTASWEKGLTYVAEGSITPEEYMQKLETFIMNRTNGVLSVNNSYALRQNFITISEFYK